MGTCASRLYSGSTATNAATAKLILSNGQLKQYSSPMKVFLVAPLLDDLTDDQSSFICNADDMNFDECLTAMSGEEELRPSQLYFQLPESWLNRRLAAEDMASLAVKAGTAVMSGGGGGGKVGCWSCVKRVDPLLFSDEDEMITSSWSTVGGGGGGGGGDGGSIGGRRGGGGGKGRMCARLEKIAEE